MKPSTQIKLSLLTFAVIWGFSLWARGPLRIETVSERAFYAQKLSWWHRFDLVIAGDSRVARALSPHRMESILPEYRIANLGFNANSLVYEPYLRYVDDTLAARRSTRVVVIGVDPYELTPRSTQHNGFIEYAGAPVPRDRRRNETDWEQKLRELLSPIPVRRITVPGETLEHFDDRGFIATQRYPIDELARVPRYRVKFDGNQVDPERFEVLFAAVEAWTARGVRVFGFEPPISTELAGLEQELSGFERDAFIEEFTRRGGIWLDDLGADYQTYDGEHLLLTSAARFSDELARRLRRELSEDR
jgi:hypothetical protein